MVRKSYWGFVLLLSGAASAFGISFRTESGVPLEISVPARTYSTRTQGVSRSLSFDVPSWVDLAGGKGQIVLAGAQSFSAEGLPQLPFVLKKFSLPAGTEPKVFLGDMSLERSDAVPQIEKAETPYVWGPQELKFVSPPRSRYYPGKFVEAKVVDGEVWVSLYPVQFDRQSGELVALRKGQLTLDFVPRPTVYLTQYERGPESVILTARAMSDAAERLKQFHSNLLGVNSQILYVETLEREPMIDEDALPDGYKDRDSVSGVLPYDAAQGTGYHYDLSRRLIHYLWKQMSEGKRLKYVTILGDATLVPPSYYFTVRTAFGATTGVTDACYGADELCLAPKIAVGRLPFRARGAEIYLAKLEGWLHSEDEPGPELGLYGGKAFRGLHYIGELGALRLLSGKTVNWNGVEKHFRTRGNFNKSESLRLIGGPQRAKVVYYLDHGRGNEWYVEKESASAKEAAAAVPAPGRINPFLVSISCTNGAFDQGIVDGTQFGPASSGDESVGMAMLKSQAGVVGSLGSPRPAVGNPLFKVDASGNLDLTGSTYGLQLMDTFLERYHTQTEGRAGDLLLQSLQRYVAGAGNNMAEDAHIWSVYNLVLLGDPVAPMVPRRKFGNATAMGRLDTVFSRPGVGNGLPYFDLGEGSLLKFPLSFIGGDGVRASLLRVDRLRDKETLIAERDFETGMSTWEWEVQAADAQGVYLLKLENKNGVPLEQQAWFGISTPRS